MVTPTPAERTYLDLVADYQSAILNYLWRMVGDAELAEDLTQETFTRAWKALDRLELDDDAEARRRAWLYRIAHNAATDHLRRRARLRWVPLDVARNRGGGDPSPGVVGRQPIERAMATLTDDHRQVLLLFAHAGLTGDEVAEVLGITSAAARKRYQRAREAFAAAWEALGGEPRPIPAAGTGDDEGEDQVGGSDEGGSDQG